VIKVTIHETDKQRVFHKCIEALKSINARNINKFIDEGYITAKLSGTLFAFGYNIKIDIESCTKNSYKIVVSSKCIGIQIIDWGINKEIEEKLIKKITSN